MVPHPPPRYRSRRPVELGVYPHTKLKTSSSHPISINNTAPMIVIFERKRTMTKIAQF